MNVNKHVESRDFWKEVIKFLNAISFCTLNFSFRSLIEKTVERNFMLSTVVIKYNSPFAYLFVQTVFNENCRESSFIFYCQMYQQNNFMFTREIGDMLLIV